MAASFLSRTWRLQFSLRALLLLFTLVGIGLTIYRWPWVETRKFNAGDAELITAGYFTFADGGWRFHTFEGNFLASLHPDYLPNMDAKVLEDYRLLTTWHRGWNGGPVRHGTAELCQQLEGKQTRVVLRRAFSEGELVRVTCYGTDGEVTHSEQHEDRQLHGVFLERNASTSLQGRCERGKATGIWTQTNEHTIIDDEAFQVELTHAFRDGLFHGDWTWKSSCSGILQTAKYDSGRIVEWNGKPIQEALAELLAPLHLTAESRSWHLSPANEVKVYRYLVSVDDSTIQEWKFLVDGIRPEFAIRNLPPTSNEVHRLLPINEIKFTEHHGTPPLQIILEHALARSETLVWRDGHLHLEEIYRLEAAKWRSELSRKSERESVSAAAKGPRDS